MTVEQLSGEIFKKQTCLCVGLDTDIGKIPRFLLEAQDPVFEFNKQIIDATQEHCVAYKINTAFYESRGWKGWETMEKTLAYIPKTHFTIADAKRGDIGNTAQQYAKAFFETLSFDAVTVSPYLGNDSLVPFLSYPDKVAIVLCHTSNLGARDYQELLVNKQSDESPTKLYQQVLSNTVSLGNTSNLFFVVGATQSHELTSIRGIIPDHFLLVPGIGTQGGDLDTVMKLGLNANGGLLVNVSRDILFSDNGEDFAKAAKQQAIMYSDKMKKHVNREKTTD